MKAKYPEIKVSLSGGDGNAFVIIGKVTSSLRRGKVSKEDRYLMSTRSPKKKDKAIFKFSDGIVAMLCNKCGVIFKTDISFSEEEWKAYKGEIELGKQYCNRCTKELKKLNKKL